MTSASDSSMSAISSMSLPLWTAAASASLVPQEMTLEPPCVSVDIGNYTTESDMPKPVFRILR